MVEGSAALLLPQAFASMNYDNLDPKKVEAAKRLAQGPLGQEAAKFPLMFAAALFFGRQPRIGVEPELNNGTISFLDLGYRQIGITCFHVLDAFRKKREQDPTVDCYLGLLPLDLLFRIIDQDRDLDIVTLDLSGLNLQHVSEEREIGQIIPYLFPHLRGTHRGKRIQDFKRVWKTACVKAGCPGMLRHDFRRTAVRNMVNLGVAERVAMKVTGHKTRSVFDRYHIVSPADLQEVARKLTGTF
jgi:hypothetical protein